MIPPQWIINGKKISISELNSDAKKTRSLAHRCFGGKDNGSLEHVRSMTFNYILQSTKKVRLTGQRPCRWERCQGDQINEYRCLGFTYKKLASYSGIFVAAARILILNHSLFFKVFWINFVRSSSTLWIPCEFYKLDTKIKSNINDIIAPVKKCKRWIGLCSY